jgi:outer membrane protein OmpA-like peptidoglycan-associated protein
MRKTLIVIAVIAALVGSTAQASESDSNREEGIGFGVGLAVGSVGGPIGAWVGAVAGIHLGKLFARAHDADELTLQVHSLESQIEANQEEATRLQLALADSRSSMAAAREQLARQIPSEQVAESVGFDLLFRTGESSLMETGITRLQQLGQLLSSRPDLQLRLDGFADGRGDTDFNQALSEARVASVRHALEEFGIAGERIQAGAWGESHASSEEGDLDGYALERRVSIQVLAPSSSMSARSNEQ